MRKFTALLFIMLFSLQVFAATPSSAIVYEVRTTGASTNGGGFKTGATGTDWTGQAGCKYSLSGLTSSGAGSVILTASAAADWVGNVINIASGTNFTAGFFEITSISAGVSATVSTRQDGIAVTTGVGASGVGCIGGAYKFGTSVDPVFAAGIAPGNTVWVQSGTYPTLANSMSFTDCTVTKQCFFTGYNSAHSDNPSIANSPVINLGATSNDFGADAVVSNLSFTGTATTPLTSDGSVTWYNIKSINTSTSANRSALNPGAGDKVIKGEFISQAGKAINFSTDVFVVGAYIHDSATCISSSSAGYSILAMRNVLAGCATTAINLTGANASNSLIMSNTIYGSERQDGVGLAVATGNSGAVAVNNILYGLTTAISATTANTANWSLNNYFNNNGTNRTNWLVGIGDGTTAPAFLSVTTQSGSAGSVSGSVLTDNAATFTSVTDNQDYLVIQNGTGVTSTPGSLLITGHTTHTVTTAAAIGGSGSNISYFVRTGHNFAPGPAMANIGFPGALPGGFSTSYEDVGALHTQNTDAGIANVLSTASYTFQNGSKTGTYVGPTAGTVQTGTSYGNSQTGTYDGSDRWSDPGIAKVSKGTVYKANSTSNNRTGTRRFGYSAGGFGGQ